MPTKVYRSWTGEDSDRSAGNRSKKIIFTVTGVNSSSEAETATDDDSGLTIPEQNDAFVDRGGTSYPSIKCDGIRSATTGFQKFDVTCTYSIPADGDKHTGDGIDDDPLNAPTQYSWEVGSTRETIDLDINSAAIVNTAGDPPDFDVTRDVTLVYLNATRNVPTFDASDAISYTNRLNGNAFFGALAGESKCVGIWGSNVTTESAAYWQVRYRFEFRDGFPFGAGNANGYQMRFINRGVRALINGRVQHIVQDDEFDDVKSDAERKNLTQESIPRLLNLDGSLRDPSLDPIILEFDIYPSANFNALNL